MFKSMESIYSLTLDLEFNEIDLKDFNKLFLPLKNVSGITLKIKAEGNS